MKGQIERQPQGLGVPDKPDAENKRNRHHDAERDNGIADPDYVIKEGPRAQRRQYRESIADGDVRQKIAALAHEEVAATRTASRTVKVSVEQLSLSADRAA